MKSIKFFGWLTLILFVLVGIAATSDYWENIFPFNEGSFVWSGVFFFSTAGAGLLVLSLLILVVLIMIDRKRNQPNITKS